MSDTGSVTDEPNDVAPGDTVGGRYVVEEVLGRGGMGIVVAARHEPLGHRVAMKLVSGSASADAFERFTREARIVASLESDHVVRVTDFGMHGAIPFMVMDLLSGRDLSRELKLRERLPAPEAVDYVIQACDGLWAAHAKGVVHRDVKPGNLFLATRASGERTIKVLDFGVSKLAVEDDATELTRTSSMLGSPLYMSPEQVRDPRNVDARADVWSLGIVLHKLMTGQAPFDGQTASALCAAIAADPPTLLRVHGPHLPAALEAVVTRCLEKSPARRYPNVVALARDLMPFATPEGRAAGAQLLARAEDDGVPAESGALSVVVTESPLEQTVAATVVEPRPTPRTKRWAVLGAVLVLLLGTSGVVALRSRSAPRPTASETVAPTPPTLDPSPSVVVAEPPAAIAAPSVSSAPTPAVTSESKKRRRPSAPPAASASARGKTGFGGTALDGHD
jgi:serine/threonine protein kinase